MDVPSRKQDAQTEPEREDADDDTIVTAHETRPGNVVFTERDNSDGWIATDLTVELER